MEIFPLWALLIFKIDKQKVQESSEYSVNQKHTDLDFNASNEKEREVSTSTATDAITAP